jgi:hypothetical protein
MMSEITIHQSPSLLSGINITIIHVAPTPLEQPLQTSALPIFSTYSAETEEAVSEVNCTVHPERSVFGSEI